MNTSFKEQINAISIIRNRLMKGLREEPKPIELNPHYLSDCLNDAMSSIASLNLTKEVKSEREAQLEEALKESLSMMEQTLSYRENNRLTGGNVFLTCTIEKAKSLLKLNT